jgi:hypothetical protein
MWGKVALSKLQKYLDNHSINIKMAGAIGDGIADDTAVIQAALNTRKPVYFPAGSYLFTDLTFYGNTVIFGAGLGYTTLKYNGTGTAFAQSTPNTRIYNVHMRDFILTDNNAGVKGLDLNSVSSGHFYNLAVIGFDTCIEVSSTINGGAVYNNFFNCKAQSGTYGFVVGPVGCNSNSFIACRTNICGTGVLIQDSNCNTFTSCEFESNTVVAWKVTSSSSGLSNSNTVIGTRFESNALNWLVDSVNVIGTKFLCNHILDSTITNNGTRTQIYDVGGTISPLLLHSALQSDNGSFRYIRTANGGSETPLAVFRDEVTSTGTPVTVQAETERTAGSFFRGKRGGTTYFDVKASGQIIGVTQKLTGATPTVSAGEVGFGVTTATTVGAAGGAAALPATPVGYLTVNIGGTNYKVPYYTS